PPASTLLPYTPLFRSAPADTRGEDQQDAAHDQGLTGNARVIDDAVEDDRDAQSHEEREEARAGKVDRLARVVAHVLEVLEHGVGVLAAARSPLLVLVVLEVPEVVD